MSFDLYLQDMTSRAPKGRKLRNIVFIAITVIIAVIPAVLTSKYGFGISPILTSSMQPSANPGDVYITRLVPAATLKVGEIIAINNQLTGTYYSHRINEIRDASGAMRIITKGDANPDIDLDPYMVAGYRDVSKMVARIPYVGSPMVYMNTIQGRQAAASFLVLANIFGLFVFLFRRKIFQSLDSERVYKELYAEERRNSLQFRELFENLQESLAIEKEGKEKVGSIR